MLRVGATGQRELQYRSYERGLRKRIALAGLERGAIVRGSQVALEANVLSRDRGMCTQIISKREVAALLLSPENAQMHVMRTRPCRRLLEPRINQVEVA